MRRDASAVLAVALASRLAVVAWAAGDIPPSADGAYYHRLATRLAEGQGYTWLWPDGAVTYAAHYPVGYPAMIAALYALFGAKPVLAMIVNASLGAAGAVAVHGLLVRATRPRLALLGGLAFALHPALVPYTAALMTEGVTVSLLALAAACVARARAASGARPTSMRRWTLALGVALGIATLVRPQSLALAPVLGALAVAPPAPLLRRCRASAVATLLALLVCAPWTARNCARMQQCSLVSVNGGWNLLIGTQTTEGGWQEMKVPEACKDVFAEAAKDACFGAEARREILAAPLAWLARAPRKLRVTFDYFGAAPWYLHEANRERFPWRAKVALGSVETLASRLLLAAALVSAWKLAGPRRALRRASSAVGLVSCVLVPGTIGYLALASSLGLLGARRLMRASVLLPTTCAAIVATAAIHAVFFGAGRYGLVVVPFVTALAFVREDPGVVTDEPATSRG